jgi:hypothetical protein
VEAPLQGAGRGVARGEGLYIGRGVIIPVMSLNAFFELLKQLSIFLAIITLGMAFVYLFTSGEETRA